jgi:hypothetical protein
MEEPSILSILARWIPIFVVLGLFLLSIVQHSRRMQALQRENNEAVRQNTDALDKLRQQLEKQQKS